MIDHLHITNFLGVRNIDHLLGACVLVAGPNAIGKTSLLDAIAFALTGDLRRVSLKKHAPAIVSDGAKTASVELTFTDDSRLSRALPSGNSNGEPAASYQSPLLPLVLNAAGFASLPVTERRALLFDVTGTTLDRQWVGDRLAQEKIPLRIIEQTLPLLRSGFDAACTAAGAKTSEARGAWKAITGEAYGSNKGVSWSAPRPVIEHDVEALRAELTNLQASQTKAHERLGVVRAAGSLGEIPTADAVVTLRATLVEAEAKLAGLRGEQATLLAAAEAAKVGGIQCPCPECGAVVVIDKGELKKYVAGSAAVSAPKAHSAAADLARKIVDAEKWISDKRGKVAQMQAQRDTAAALGESDSDGATLESLQTEIETGQARIALLRMQINTTDEAARALKAADESDTKAKTAHEDVGFWDRTAKLLAPDGLPAELLLKAVAPFRELLTDAPEGWRSVTLGDDMEIRVGGRAYALCSESERWRADTVCTVALALLGNVPLVLLDRLDVLEPAARGPTLTWLSQLAAETDVQVIAAATLKAPPIIEGIHTLWMGETVEAAAKKKVA